MTLWYRDVGGFPFWCRGGSWLLLPWDSEEGKGLAEGPSFYYADGSSERLLIATDPDVAQAFVAVDDIGAAAASAFADPRRFDGVELELAGDLLTFREVARTLSEVRSAPVTLPADLAELRASGLRSEFLLPQEYMSTHPAPARPEFARALGLPTTALADWARATF